MIRQLRISNLLVALVAFAAGIGFASLFSPVLYAPPIEEKTWTFESKSRECAAQYNSLTERDRAIEDAIRSTELKLIEVKKKSSLYSPRVEKFQNEAAG